MFERVMALYENKDPRQPGVERVSRMLKVQYRMHEKIANWASQALYGGELQTHASVKSRTLSQLVAESNATSEESDVTNLHQSTLLLIDTSGYDMHESTNAVGSRFNEGEAQLVVTHVRKLLAMGIPADQIAVISPYNGQVEVLRLALLPEAPTLQIRSVDGFQGGEREAVVISLVRSSSRGGMNGIGFLRDDRRLNVAVTRAKRHCCVICDAETVSQSPFVKSLINWIETHGEVMSPDDDDQMKADLEQAEHELCRLVESESMRISSSRCETNSAIPESRRLALTEIIRSFQVDAIPSESMVMSLELTKLDRKTVHEIAEEIGLGHRSEGVEGIDRRITLFVPERPITHSAEQLAAPFRKVLLDDADTVLVEQNGKCSVAVIVPSLDTQNLTEGKTEANTSVAVIEQESDSDDEDVIATTGQRGDTLTGYVEESQQLSTSQFALLNATAEDDDDVEEHDDVEDLDHISSNHEFNSVLGSLAKQRSERGRYRQKSDEKPKTKPKKGKQLGGSKKSAAPVDDALHEMDDFAFLDAQIDKVQNSHGRQVVGTGKTYRTIVNGVLLARPKAAEKKKNSNASTALNAMLRDAKNDRKSKQNK